MKIISRAKVAWSGLNLIAAIYLIEFSLTADAASERYPNGVIILAALFVLYMLMYSYSYIFETGALAVRMSRTRWAIGIISAIIICIYITRLQTIDLNEFSSYVIIPMGLSVLYILASAVTLCGEGFLGVINKVFTPGSRRRRDLDS